MLLPIINFNMYHIDQTAEHGARDARQYDRLHNWLFLVDTTIALLVLVALMWRGERGLSFALERLAAAHLGSNPWLVAAGYTIIVVVGYTVLMLPYSWWKGFRIEHQFNLSTQSFPAWLWDELKSLFLTLLLAITVVEIFYLFLRCAKTTWWLWAAGAWICIQVGIGMLFPVVIIPLFYKTTRLDRADLEAMVSRLAVAAGVTILGIFRIDLSSKTRKANAALAGIGRTRRILLGDTLLDQFAEGEVLSVLAHEFGHFYHRHIPKLVMAASVAAVAGMWTANHALRWSAVTLGIADITNVATLPLLLLALFLFSLVTMPLTNALCRHFERQADQYALEATGDALSFIGAMERLADRNLANRMPHPVIEFLLHSHPSISRRIAFVRAWQKTRENVDGGSASIM